MNSGGHKRKMDGSEGMGFQNVMSRARATKLDPFEHMMATKVTFFSLKRTGVVCF